MDHEDMKVWLGHKKIEIPTRGAFPFMVAQSYEFS